MLNGQKLQGPETAAEVNYMLKARVRTSTSHVIVPTFFCIDYPLQQKQVYLFCSSKPLQQGLEGDFPLFTTVHRICIGELQPEDLLTSLRNHPEHQ